MSKITIAFYVTYISVHLLPESTSLIIFGGEFYSLDAILFEKICCECCALKTVQLYLCILPELLLG